MRGELKRHTLRYNYERKQYYSPLQTNQTTTTMLINPLALGIIVSLGIAAPQVSAQEANQREQTAVIAPVNENKVSTKQKEQNMATVTLKNQITIHLNGNLPAVGTVAPNFTVVKGDLSEVKLSDYKGKRVVLNIFPSVDTGVCAASVRRFNAELSGLENTVVLCLSKDLPFALARFCGAEGLTDVVPASAFRCGCLENGYGVLQTDGPLKGLLARAVVVIDEEGKVIYTELVPEITQDPNFDAALAVLK